MNRMYQDIENIVVRTLSPFEYQRLEELKKFYTEDEIVEAYKNYVDKNINYITQVLKNKKKVPSWLNKEIKNKQLTKEDIDLFNDFNSFIEEFRK